MEIFLSWSGVRARAVAIALKTWLPSVNYAIRPWMSETDIHAGKRWSDEIQAHLKESRFSIICITPENQDAPWINFEAGAASNHLTDSRVAPYTLGIQAGQITSPPLRQFQAKEANKKGTMELLSSINSMLDSPMDLENLKRVFEVWWPHLEPDLESALSIELMGEKPSGLDFEQKIDLLIQMDSERAAQIREIDNTLSTLAFSRASAPRVEEAIWESSQSKTREFLSVLPKRLQAFIKPASINVSTSTSTLVLSFDKSYGFHRVNLEKSLVEVETYAKQVFGDAYTVSVVVQD